MTLSGIALVFGVVAGAASLLGLLIAFLQLRAVSSRAKVASETAAAVQGLLQSRSVLYEISICSQAVSDARNYLRIGQAQSALYRVEGLASRLSTIRKLDWFTPDDRANSLRTALAGVALVRASLDSLVSEDVDELPVGEKQKHMRRLGQTEDQLHEWIGELRHAQEEKRQ